MKFLVAVCALFLGVSMAHADDHKSEKAEAQTQEQKAQDMKSKKDGVIKQKKAVTDEETENDQNVEEETSH